MITKKQQEKVTNVVSVESFVPHSWKLWALVFEAMAEDSLAFKEKKTLNVIDGTYVDETSFDEAINALYYESCNRVSREFPVELYRLASPEEVLEQLELIASRIRKAYLSAKCFLESESDVVRKIADRVFDNCDVILKLLRLQRDMRAYEENQEYLYSSLSDEYLFLNSDVLPLHQCINGRIIDEIDYNSFYRLLNLELRTVTVDGYDEPIGRSTYFVPTGEYVDDISNMKIIPCTGYGMAMYAMILKLMIMRNLNSRAVPQLPVETECGLDSEPDPCGWATSFSVLIEWKSDRYDVLEERWRDYYYDEDLSKFHSGISEENRSLLSRLCRRPTFEFIFARDNVHLLRDAHDSTPGFYEYEFIHSLGRDSEDALKLFYTLCKEIDFLYANRKRLEDDFDEEDTCKYKQDHSRYRHDRKVFNNDAISKMFAQESPSDELVYMMLMERSHMGDEYLWNQPIVTREQVSAFIKACILKDEMMKLILYQAMNTPSFEEVEIKPIPQEASTITVSDGFDDLRNGESPCLTVDNAIRGPKSQFVRALVRNGHIKADRDWKALFSVPRWLKIFSPDSEVVITDEELRDFTGLFRWYDSDIDNRFTFKGVKQTWQMLQKAFSDGDATNKFRISTIKELFVKVMTETLSQ